ncbi:MAG TPA: hypothetical protein VHD90_12360 [Phototrophicaceae bacterium]|nr:hypothetical protein [Phototrophicaceae bacterium]
MASATNWRTRPEAPPRPREDVSISPSAQLLALLALSLPYLLLGWLTQTSLFLGDSYAHLLARTLVALGDGRLENVVLGYPLIPSLLAALRPAPSTLMIGAALTAGATLWLLWRTLAAAPMNVIARLVLLFAFAVVPTTTFLATQSFGEMLALFLFVIAWNNYVAFARTNTTWKGFVAGLLIGLAFFVNLYALVYGLILILFAPFYLYDRRAGSFRQQRARILTGTVVIAFPALASFLAWTYLSWLFTGDPFSYVRDVISPLSAFADSASAPLLGWSAVLNASLSDVLRLPLYLAVGIVTIVCAPHRFLTLLMPLLVIVVTRALGWAYTEPFALATLTVVALVGLPLHKRLAWLLIPAALLQIAFAYGLADRSTEQTDWRNVLFTDAPTLQAQTEAQIAARLAVAPPHSVLIDSSANDRLIARMGTALPLMDADNAAYELATSAPAQYVDFIVIIDGDQLAQRFDLAPPQGFILDTSWSGGRLYRRADLS